MNAGTGGSAAAAVVSLATLAFPTSQTLHKRSGSSERRRPHLAACHEQVALRIEPAHIRRKVLSAGACKGAGRGEAAIMHSQDLVQWACVALEDVWPHPGSSCCCAALLCARGGRRACRPLGEGVMERLGAGQWLSVQWIDGTGRQPPGERMRALHCRACVRCMLGVAPSSCSQNSAIWALFLTHTVHGHRSPHQHHNAPGPSTSMN